MSEPEQTFEQRVRERAYRLWDADGQPNNNMAGEYWRRASAEIEAEILAEQDRIIAAARAENRKP